MAKNVVILFAQSILEYSQGVCNLGQLYNPTEVDINAPECNASNIDACAVGDLSGKLGTISISDNPIGGAIGAWTDGNLHNYNISRKSIGLFRVSNGVQQVLACANIVELTATNGIVNTDNILFTTSQRSPFDPTMINVAAGVPEADYQINLDGNVRDDGSTMCYSNEVYQPFEPFQAVNTNVTFDTYAVGDLSGKHMIQGGAVLSDKILPLSNLYSALGHNVMVTPNDGSSATCGTLGFTSGSNVRIIRASAGFDSDTMTGRVYLVSDSGCNLDHFEMHILQMQILTMLNNRFIPGPTLLYWQLRHNIAGMEEVLVNYLQSLLLLVKTSDCPTQLACSC